MNSRRKRKPDLLISLIIAVALALAATLVLQVNAQAGSGRGGALPLLPHFSVAPRG